jgi:ABC-type amino acid transport substrate-binding protein
MPTRVNPRIGPLLFVLALLLLAAGGCRANTGSWERIKGDGVLRVGLDPTYPPFEIADETGVVGLDVDLVNAIAGELGLRTEFVYFGYDGLYDALATEQVDVLISALVIVPGRMRDFSYSEPYFNAGEILIIPAGSGDISEMTDLNGRILAVELGAQGHVEGTQWAKRLPELTIQPYGSAEEALTAVANDEADAALVDNISGRLYLSEQTAEQGPLNLVSPPITVEPYALVVRIEDEMLLEKISGALGILTSSGQLELIIQRWLGG